MKYNAKDASLLAEAYDDLGKAADANELSIMRGIIDNLAGYVDYLEGIRLDEANTAHEPLSKFRSYLAKHIGPGMIGQWKDNKYRKGQE